MHIFDLEFEELSQLVAELGHKPYRAAQIWDHLFKNISNTTLYKDLSTAKTLPAPLRNALSERLQSGPPKIAKDLLSQDGTRKWLFGLSDNNEVETVFIPEKNRGTLCISSQVGCTLNCTFCHTGTQPLVRNLTASEIVLQFLHALYSYGRNDHKGIALEADNTLTNVVMMGMGEPLLNYENVRKALTVIMDKRGLNFSRKRITLSTSGIIPEIMKCAKDLQVNLAISLHAAFNDLRTEIVPINKYPLAELLEACREYTEISNTDRITFEYVMLDGINDSAGDAQELVGIISGIPCKINIIPFNPWPNSSYKCSSMNKIRAFAEIVESAGYPAPIRRARGQDIFAACGQLKSESVRERKQLVG